MAQDLKHLNNSRHPVQETTFNSANQADGANHFFDSRSWLDALYSEASLKKFDQNELYHIISHNISFQKIENKINYSFKDKNFLIMALIQSTFCYEMKEANIESNERLEFVGDSLINFIVGKNLYLRYRHNDEGDLSKLRGALVNEAKLAELARAISLGEYIFLGKGEFKSGGNDKDSILADTFEALFAAIYFDSNNNVEILEKVFGEIVALYEKQTKKDFYSLEQLEIFDTKSKLQEITMAERGVLPAYKSHELPNGEGFQVEIWLEDKKIVEMKGSSKKKIEKLLAKKMIDEKLY